VEIVTDITTRN